MRCLFISHDAGRAGAQLLLLGFIQWLKQTKPDVHIDLLLNGKGDLLADFEQSTKVMYWVKPTNERDTWYSSFRKKQKRNQLLRSLKKANYQLVYSNTFMNGEILKSLSVLSVPMLTHTHELEFWIDKSGEKNKQEVIQFSNFFIAASQAVKRNLLSYAIPDDRIKVIYEYTDCKTINEDKSASLKSKLNLPAHSKIVGACGAESFRKGKDLFIPIAEKVLHQQQQEPIHFVWIGGRLDQDLQNAWEQSTWKEQIHFIDHLPQAAQYFHEFNLFLMLSRNDPFPVVNLEAGARGIPILCFDESGGSKELLDHDPASVIPFLNIEEMAQRCTYLLEHNEERNQLGRQLQQKVKQQYDLSTIGEQLLETLKQVAKSA